MGKRPRIKRPVLGSESNIAQEGAKDNVNSTDLSTTKVGGSGIVNDPMEFKENKASKNARLSETINHRIILDLWHEKHYVLRNVEREGIEPDAVRQLVSWSMKHLLYYSAFTKEFNFLNHNNPNGRGIYNSILLQDTYSGGTILNVPIEVHFIDFFRYEITVFTAMRVHDFDIYDGQYVLEMKGEFESELTRMVKKQRIHIGECIT